MKSIELNPVKIPTKEWEEIEEKILRVFRDKIFNPLLKEVYQKPSVLKNSADDLLEAIQNGKITFNRGIFSGEFNSSISKDLRDLGAKWDRSKGVYKIQAKDLPYNIRGAISASYSKFEQKLKSIDEKIMAVVPDQLVKHIKIDNLFDKSLWKVNKSFQDAVKKVTIPPQLSDAAAELLRSEWRENIDKSIKGIADEVLPKLRKEIQQSVFEGNRYGYLLDTLQKNYRLSASRAKYVARNETNLMMSKFKQGRLADVGIHNYKWVCVKGTPDHQVRPIHRKLTEDGKIHDFRNPPIAEENGQRYNPHERNNCRCTAVPVLSWK